MILLSTHIGQIREEWWYQAGNRISDSRDGYAGSLKIKINKLDEEDASIVETSLSVDSGELDIDNIKRNNVDDRFFTDTVPIDVELLI